MTEDSKLRTALPSTLMATNLSHLVPSGPRIENPFNESLALLLTSTMYGRPAAFCCSASGARKKVDLDPAPTIVRSLGTVNCSTYVPESTSIVSPDFAALIAAWIVGKSFGTVVTDAALLVC